MSKATEKMREKISTALIEFLSLQDNLKYIYNHPKSVIYDKTKDTTFYFTNGCFGSIQIKPELWGVGMRIFRFSNKKVSEYFNDHKDIELTSKMKKQDIKDIIDRAIANIFTPGYKLTCSIEAAMAAEVVYTNRPGWMTFDSVYDWRKIG